MDQYRKAEPAWEIVLDLDELNKTEKENWVFKGTSFLKKGGNRLALLSLSRGGADAVVVREFDVVERQFVKDGFELPEAKGDVSWIDENHVFVATDFGPGSMTTSGYPRVVRLWERGTPLAESTVVYEGVDSDVTVEAVHDDTPGFERDFVYRAIAFYLGQMFVRNNDNTLIKVEIPEDAEADFHREWMLVSLRTPWTVGGKTFQAGSLIATRFDDFMQGGRKFDVLFEPTLTTSLAGQSWTRNHLILNVLEDVKSSLSVLTPEKDGWKRQSMQGVPTNVQVDAWGVDSQENDDFFMVVKGFLDPDTLYAGTIGGQPEKLKSMPAQFDATGLEVSQHFATSKDGTRVPYFQVNRQGMVHDGSNTTLVNGYGGFEISRKPRYSGMVGRSWLQQGGVYVLTNIRGGGEYGPRWHQAALKQNRHRAYEDFAAIAHDLVERKVTSVDHLGAIGGSNGGLLMGNMITHYYDSFGAIVCQVPLLDMKRYNKLLAGASWMAEYGNPDKPEEWEFIKTFSAYHNLRGGVKYPPTLFVTSTRDDRVHPGHARKMMARMQAMGADVRYYENTEGGHGAAADNGQMAFIMAMSYTFLWNTIGQSN